MSPARLAPSSQPARQASRHGAAAAAAAAISTQGRREEKIRQISMKQEEKSRLFVRQEFNIIS